MVVLLKSRSGNDKRAFIIKVAAFDLAKNRGERERDGSHYVIMRCAGQD